MEILLSRDDRKRLEQYAAHAGMTVDQAATDLARAELGRRYRLSRSNGDVVPFQALKRPDESTR
ncbi:hypothetical protein [Stenotrophomonas rhizophila]|uniref:hypothetical protein n=1 Tax=Stenotrophomonas rhizophila TaxID=216778 RepID=UPI0028B2529F|nr:hypothetical protein [Stenotrophomonas rhizophila]